MINLTDKQTLELLDVALFQRDMAKQRLYQLETTEGPMSDYNPEAYWKKAGDLRNALVFWEAIVTSCRSPVDTNAIREEEQRRAMEAVKARKHFYYGPDCVFCGCYGPIDGNDPCLGVDGEVFSLGRSEGRADIAVELRKIIDPNDEQHLSLDGTLEIVRKLTNLL